MTDESKPEYRTKTGRILTTVELEALADEAERGYDVDNLSDRRRPHTSTSMVEACDDCRNGFPTQIAFANAVIKAAKQMYMDDCNPLGGVVPFVHLVGQYELQYGGVW